MTMITLIPADLHSRIALGTRVLGGSIRETRPQKENPASLKLKFAGLVTLKIVELRGNSSRRRWSLAKPRTLSPFLPKRRLTLSNLVFHS